MARAAAKTGVPSSPDDTAAILERVARSKHSAAFAGDPLNIAKRKLKGAGDEVELMAVLRKAIKAKERVVGDGTIVSGTGLTVGKLREPTIGRLITSGKIGQIELQALQEIERVYTHLCKRLLVRGYEIKERASKSASIGDPAWFLDAYYGHYKPWADDWSRRRNLFGDKTLEVVFDVMMSDKSGKDIDRDNGWRHGMALKVFVAGLRDYAASAGWTDPRTASRWKDAARELLGKPKQSARAAYRLAAAVAAARV